MQLDRSLWKPLQSRKVNFINETMLGSIENYELECGFSE